MCVLASGMCVVELDLAHSGEPGKEVRGMDRVGQMGLLLLYDCCLFADSPTSFALSSVEAPHIKQNARQTNASCFDAKMAQPELVSTRLFPCSYFPLGGHFFRQSHLQQLIYNPQI